MDVTQDGITFTFDRGLVSRLRLSWYEWLHHHAALYWHPEQTAECPFVATAQPLEVVQFSSVESHHGEYDEDEDGNWIMLATDSGVYRFVRVKCATCDGYIIDDYRGRNLRPCPTCHGTPPNRWTCDKWKGLEFTMPEAAAHEVAPPAAGWTWRVDRSGLTTPINHFTVIGLLTVHLEWFHQWDGDAPTLGTQFRIDQPNITTEAFLASVEPELRGRERWLRLTAVVIGVPIFRGESVLR